MEEEEVGICWREDGQKQVRVKTLCGEMYGAAGSCMGERERKGERGGLGGRDVKTESRK